tara:strand:- start:385 stop:741 length:357 start_codon:yes stop_codon:yes gene_type:complete
MSSLLTFSEEIKSAVWNSTFKTILRKLEGCSAENPTAAKILAENPIARPIGGLNLTSHTDDEIIGFISIITSLRDSAAQITQGCSFPKQVAQFPIDLEITIEMANKAVVATGYRSKSK